MPTKYHSIYRYLPQTKGHAKGVPWDKMVVGLVLKGVLFGYYQEVQSLNLANNTISTEQKDYKWKSNY